MARAETRPPALEAITGAGLLDGLSRALHRLQEQKGRINDLNVFPVPDGDTGSNMHLTLQAAVEEAARVGPGAAIGEVAKAAAHGSLMGARGNSGVILSQVLRGFSASCAEESALGPKALAAALQEASRVARRAVKRPVEGTILSVIRDASQAASEAAASGASLAALTEATVAEAWAAVERSRDQLEELRRAGVVDAGGFGLAVILTAVSEQITGPSAWPSDIANSESTPGGEQGIAATAAPPGGFGYCTEFSLVGSERGANEVRALLGSEDEDDSSLVVGERGLFHVHIHTQEPWEVLSKAAELGKIERLKVEDMTAQHHEARQRLGSQGAKDGRVPLGVVAVAQGFGFRQLLLGLGAASVVDGGQGMNPSTEEMLQAIDAEHLTEVLLLPNNPNLIMGAEQTARGSRREVGVVPTRNLPQGIAALLAFDPEAALEVNRRRMERAMAEVRAIEVTQAVRATTLGDHEVRQGDFVALLDGELVASAQDLAGAVLGALAQLDQAATEVLTLYRGASVVVAQSEELERRIRQEYPAWEIERQDGGQAVYPFIISAD